MAITASPDIIKCGPRQEEEVVEAGGGGGDDNINNITNIFGAESFPILGFVKIFRSRNGANKIIVLNARLETKLFTLNEKNFLISANHFVYFRTFNITIQLQTESSINGVLGILTRGHRKVGAGRFIEQWRPPNEKKVVKLNLYRHWTVVVAQLVEQSLRIPQICSSMPVIANYYREHY